MPASSPFEELIAWGIGEQCTEQTVGVGAHRIIVRDVWRRDGFNAHCRADFESDATDMENGGVVVAQRADHGRSSILDPPPPKVNGNPLPVAWPQWLNTANSGAPLRAPSSTLQ